MRTSSVLVANSKCPSIVTFSGNILPSIQNVLESAGEDRYLLLRRLEISRPSPKARWYPTDRQGQSAPTILPPQQKECRK